jgi:hypothetical protein
MSFVPFDEFQIRYENTVPAADEERVGAFLEDACALVADITGVTYVDGSGSEVPGAIVAAVCTAVRRAYENPSGLGGETIGDYSWRVSTAGSGVYFTPDEARIMRRAAGKSSVGTLELEGMLPNTIDDAQYLGVVGSSEPILYFDREDLL